jgi:peptidoglycan hydrolase CwlO-like protein
MDLYKAIQELRDEKMRLDRAIAALEKGVGSNDARSERRAWNAEARRAAAERMKKYWAQRKQQAAGKAAPAGYNVNPPSIVND